MSKVWRVSVTIDFDMPVYADNVDDAREVAEENYIKELRNDIFDRNVNFHAFEISKPGDLGGCIPWGEEDDRTVAEILADKAVSK